jgi:GAF domain-containing protein/anti-sigma regulatory factor (Ser/Thr protein kinase)
MIGEVIELDLIEVFNSLSGIPLSIKEEGEALQRITDLGRKALHSHACNLTFVDLENMTLTQAACSGFDEGCEDRMANRSIKMGSVTEDGVFLDYELIMKGELVERYNLQDDGQGIANPKTARRHNLSAILAYPLKWDGRVVGYFNHFSSDNRRFNDREKGLLEIFARQALLVIDRFEYYQTLERSLGILRDQSGKLLSVPEQEFLEQVPENACKLLSVPICIVWKFDVVRKRLKIAATAGDVDDEYKKIELKLDDPGLQHLSKRGVRFLLDVTEPHPKYYRHREHAKDRAWVSLLTAPMWVEDRLIGMLDVYTDKKRYFKDWEKGFFEAFANYTASSIQKAELLKQSEENLRLKKLNQITQEMAEASDVDQLLELMLDRGLELVGASRGWVSRFDPKTGELNIIAHRGELSGTRALELGRGITGRALHEEKAIKADDVRSPEWHGVYEQFWEDTHSELAIPIFISNAQVRIGHEIKSGTKPIGVLNIESPFVAALSQSDEDILSSMTRQAAIIIERLEVDRKFANLRKIEREIAGKRDWDETIRIVLRAITDTLGYEYVNISLVDPDLNRIRTKYVVGIHRKEVELFKRMADHPLDSDDIQAQIVRSRETEVPDIEDPHFDQRIYKRFGHERLIRVFIPMIVASEDRVIGTVEAGYKRSYRKYIYERDVQILRGFVNYAVRALEQSKRGLLPRISHEFTAPIVGIRSNTSYLQRRIGQLDDSILQVKLDDILTDSEILLLRVGELEHILGGTTPVSRPELTLVYRDIIIKTVNQLKPLVAERGFDMSMIKYNTRDIHRIKIYVDRAKLNSVVYNLLINSIKYAEDDSSAFKTMISVDETKGYYIIKFQDWGIGIKKPYEERIFEDGFRAPEAINRFVTGSGLGLTIARKTMREMDGDLRLANNHKPTEFDLLLPKSLKEVPDDSLRR